MDFTSEFFTGNRQRLLEATGAELIVLSANGLLQRTTDTTFAFRQDSNFWYLTGVEEPDYILVISVEKSFLIAPERGEHRDLWDGAIDIDALKASSGLDEIMEHHAGWNQLDRLLKKIKKAHTITPAEAYYKLFGFYTNPARMTLLTALKKHRNLELVDIRKHLAHLRQIKQDPEIAALQKAIDITSNALKEARKKLPSYKYEYEVVADITGSFIRQGSKGHAYEPIVSGGANAATIHHLQFDSALPKDSMILFDIGADVNNYSADISRTYALGEPTARMQEVFAAVERVRQIAFKKLKPGVMPREYEKEVDAVMAQELHKLGLLKNVDDKKKFRKLYPHLTSHHLGLDTHDSADYDLPLAAGMVLTVEPGIYIPDEGIGVRIEDDVLITKTGIKVLSASLPSTLF